MPPDAITKIKVISDLTLQKGCKLALVTETAWLVTKCPLIQG